MRAEVLTGLQKPEKELPCKLLYDEQGCRLFDEICELDEYYLTRSETAILENHIGEIVSAIGPNTVLIEIGSGSGRKTTLLLDHLVNPLLYVPVDISRIQLEKSSSAIRKSYPGLDVIPVCADFSQEFNLPPVDEIGSGRTVFFPGSTIGNFHPWEVSQFLGRVSELCGEGGGLLIGVDLVKDSEIIQGAYHDSAGVTARFNLNILERLNRELGADFQIDQFRHGASYHETLGRVEMNLMSIRDQTVNVGGEEIEFRGGEDIWTESSYKYTTEEFQDLAQAAGFIAEKVWMDDEKLFSVHYLTASSNCA